MSNPIRILQVSWGMERGGAETLLMNIYRHIDRTKVQFDFLLSSDYKTAYEDEIEALGGRIYHINRFLGYNKLSYDRALKKFLIEHPEHMIIHDHLMDSASETLRVAKKMGRITVAHSHIAETKTDFSDLIRFFFRRNLWRRADYRFACSKEAGEWLYRGKAGYTVLNNAIETEKFSFDEKTRENKRKELAIEQETIVVINIGRMVEQKNQTRVLDIFSRFLTKHNNSKLLIAGKGELENKLKKKAESLDIENAVMFLGERDDIPALLAASDIFLFPSLFEGLGIVLIEAEAEGLVSVFSSHLPGEVDLEKDLIYRVELSSNDWVWVEGMEEALETKIKREERYMAVKEKGYDIKEIAKKMEKFYLECSPDATDTT